MAQGSSNPTMDLKKVGGNAIATGAGTTNTGTPRVVIATDQAVIPVSDNGGSLTVDGTVAATQSGTWNIGTVSSITNALPAGTNAIGKLVANDGVDIGDVTINNASIAVTGTFWQATQPVSGTVAATQSGTWTVQPGNTANTTPWLTKLNDGTNSVAIKAASTAAAATDPALVVAISPNNTVPVSLASVPTHAVTQSGTWNVALSAGSNAIGSITNTSFASTQSGTWTVQPGNTANTTPWLTKLNDGTNSVAIKAASTAAAATDPALVVAISPNNTVTVTQATAANLNATVTGTVELGATSLAALENISVTIPGTVDLGTVSLTALESITAVSGTPGNFQSKVYGAVTTSAPTYTNATDNALSLTTTGSLRVSVTDALPAGTNAIGKLAANDGVDIGDVTINNTSIAVTGTFWQATQPVSGTVAATQSGTWTVQPGNTANTTPWLIRPSDGTNSVAIKAASTAAAATDPALVVAISPNNTVPVSLASVPTHAVTQSGTWNVGLSAGSNAIGSITNTSFASTQSGTWTVQPGNTANTTPWLTKLNDGTNSVAIKAASTAALATDPALVVAISPNNTVGLSAGTNAIGKLAANDGVDIGDVTINNASIAVTGTFWQATQPVSGTVAATQSGTWNVGLNAGTNAIGKLAANAGVIIGAVELTGSTTNVLSSATTTAYAASLVIKASAGVLYTVTGYNSNTSAQFIQIHDSASVPVDTSVPKVIFYAPASSTFSFDLGVYGRYFANGITICNSTTGPTKTIGSANCWFDAQYK